MLNLVKGGLIVSCQALEEEPLHSSFIMGRMARAANEGGAAGIRANTAQDIEEIANNTSLPIIGIVKRVYEDSDIYITPTMTEIEELADSKAAMIAIDATSRVRHGNESLLELMEKIKKSGCKKLLMADIATLDEAINAEKLGFDCVSTTLVGYTAESKLDKIEKNDFEILRNIIEKVSIPVIAEGNIDLPSKAKRCLELGAHAVVVGGAITRPQLITKKFVEAIN